MCRWRDSLCAVTNICISRVCKIDLVILNDHPTSYAQSLHEELETAVRTAGVQTLLDKPGGVFLRRADQMPEADRILLHAVARVVIVSERGSLEDQLERRPVEEPLPPAFRAACAVANLSRDAPRTSGADLLQRPRRLRSGRARIRDPARRRTMDAGALVATSSPTRPMFGFQVTETGGGFTWSVNSRENRLTPWSNDASAIRPARLFTCATKTPARPGRRRLCRFARASRTRSGTDRATPFSNTPVTASRRSCSCLRRSMRR